MVGKLSVLMLMFVFPWVLVDWTLADEPQPRVSTEDESQAEIKVVIEQLGDRDTAKRDAAARRLIEIGTPAKSQLETASKSETELDVIRRRAKMLLLSIARREKAYRWNAFVSGKSADGPPAWKKFCQAVGDTPDARKLFVDLYRAEPKLLETYETDPAKAVSRIESRCEARKIDHHNPEPLPPVFSIVTYLLVAGDRHTKISSNANRGLANMMTFDWYVIYYTDDKTPSPFVFALKNGPNKPLLRKLVGRWICNTANLDSFTADGIMLAATEYGFKEVLPIALDDLQKKLKPQKFDADQVMRSIYVIGRLGDSTHIEKIEPLLRDTRVLKEVELEVKHQVLICDLALVALLRMTKQKAKDYDTEIVGDAWDFQKIFIAPCYFKGDKQRQQALANWQKWRKEHPTLSPELIYIASDPEPLKNSRRDNFITSTFSKAQSARCLLIEN